MSTTEIRTDQAASATIAGQVDLKLEAVVIPVSDVDRAKAFYANLGWRLDADFAFDNGFRVVQFTPPGSASSVQFGTNITTAAPGSAQGLYLVVSDIEAARNQLVARGAEVSEVFHPGAPGAQFQPDGTSDRVGGPADDHASYSSFATFSDPDGNGWLLQEVTTRLPGRIDTGQTTYASVNDLSQRAAPGRGRPRRAREAQPGPVRRELAGLVRRLHGGRAGRRAAAAVSSQTSTNSTCQTNSTKEQYNMSTIHFHQTTTSTPEQFLAALTDFGPGRSKLFGNSADEYLKVHDQGPSSADVTEGSGGVWERLHYDWSDPNRVVMTTTDSNVWGGNSGHTYTFTRNSDGTTDLDVVVVREGKNLKGRVLGVVLGTIGKGVLGKALDNTVKAIEARNASERSAI